MNKTIKIGINGFGRIGRNLFRLLIDHPQIQVYAINDLADSKTLAHLLKYDSIHGVLQADIEHKPNTIIVNGKDYRYSSEKYIENTQSLGQFSIDRASEIIKTECRPITDHRSNEEYRREMAGVLLARGLSRILSIEHFGPLK